MRYLCLLGLLLLPACLDVAEGRARRDQQVGQATLAGMSISVDGGLAAVMALEPTMVALWANAPDLVFHLSGAIPGQLEVRIGNTLADAKLRGSSNEGSEISVVELDPVGDARSFAITIPASGIAHLVLSSDEPPAPFRVAVFGDVQEAWPRVQDIFDRMNQDGTIRFVLMTGDLTQRGESGQLARFKALLSGLARPCFTTIGNHELGDRDDAYHDYFGRGSSHFAHGGLHVTFLDSASATLAPQVHDWLDEWLAEGAGHPHIVLTHYPLLDPIGLRNGAFASRAEAASVLARMARAGVSASFHGHIHSYYAYSAAGIPTYISGGGGAVPEAFDGIGRHYLTVDVDPARLGVEVAVVRID